MPRLCSARPTLSTPRLDLVPLTHAMKLALRRSPVAFEALIGAALPAGWPEFPQAFEPGSDGPQATRIGSWPGYLFVLRAVPRLVGNGGFVAPPDAQSEVEIGYEVAPAFRGLGYATEAAQALIDLAFEQGAVAVVAHSLAGANASGAVLGKLGMRFVTELPHARLGAVWRWRLDRQAPRPWPAAGAARARSAGAEVSGGTFELAAILLGMPGDDGTTTGESAAKLRVGHPH